MPLELRRHPRRHELHRGVRGRLVVPGERRAADGTYPCLTWNVGFVAAASFRAGAPIVGILPSILDFEGILYAQTPGTITVSWCQNTSDVQPLQMLAGSWLSAERMDNVAVL